MASANDFVQSRQWSFWRPNLNEWCVHGQGQYRVEVVAVVLAHCWVRFALIMLRWYDSKRFQYHTTNWKIGTCKHTNSRNYGKPDEWHCLCWIPALGRGFGGIENCCILGPDNIRIDFQRIERRANTDTVQMNELMEAQTEHSSKYGWCGRRALGALWNVCWMLFGYPNRDSLINLIESPAELCDIYQSAYIYSADFSTKWFAIRYISCFLSVGTATDRTFCFVHLHIFYTSTSSPLFILRNPAMVVDAPHQFNIRNASWCAIARTFRVCVFLDFVLFFVGRSVVVF